MFQAHKCVLAARSPFFANMFDTSMMEACEGQMDINEFPPQVVQAAINYCYDQHNIDELSIIDQTLLLYFADIFKFEGLVVCFLLVIFVNCVKFIYIF